MARIELHANKVSIYRRFTGVSGCDPLGVCEMESFNGL